jgi:plastocyanin
MQSWWLFLHVASVLWLLGAHGASMTMLFRLRAERDPAKVDAYLQLSGTSARAMYASLIAVIVTGSIAAFTGHWWGYGWIWAALGVLILATLAMLYMAKPYYRRVGTIARAMAGGSKAVTDEQFDRVLREPRPLSVAGIGIVAFGLILYLMVFKPTLGLEPTAKPVTAPTSGECRPDGTTLRVNAHDFAFDPTCLAAPADTPFRIVFDDTQGTHNLAIYTDETAKTSLFVGDIVTGPRTETYSVNALPAGTYFFRCDVHPTQMTGVFVVGAGSPSPSTPTSSSSTASPSTSASP